jgi:hypothetical protein
MWDLWWRWGRFPLPSQISTDCSTIIIITIIIICHLGLVE